MKKHLLIIVLVVLGLVVFFTRNQFQPSGEYGVFTESHDFIPNNEFRPAGKNSPADEDTMVEAEANQNTETVSPAQNSESDSRGPGFATFHDQLNQFESEARNLRPEEALARLPRLTLKLQEIRKSNPRQGEAEELEMNMIAAVLEEFPAADSFEKSKCDSYKNNILVLFEPTAEERPTAASTLRAFRILELICR